MKKLLKIALGIITSIGGFMDAGAFATSTQAGGRFGFQLLWPVVLGTICVIFLVEMSGRLSIGSGHTLAAAVRERFGWHFFLMPFIAELLVDTLVLGAELGGVSIGLQLFTGIHYTWFVIPVALLLWFLIWSQTFDHLENGSSLLGLVTLCFVVAAFKLHPPTGEVFRGMLPSLPKDHASNYWFTAVGMFGATLSPYLFFFYSSGAIEEKWSTEDLRVNRVVASVGMSFGAIVNLAAVVVAGMVLLPAGIGVERLEDAAVMLTKPLGIWGYYLFAGSIVVACFGACLEIALDLGFITAQGLGWNWSETEHSIKHARFNLSYTMVIGLAALLMVTGIDPLKLTIFTMALTALTAPLIGIPFLVLLNDEHFVGEHRNGWLSNSVVTVIILLSFVVALVAIPLELAGGG